VFEGGDETFSYDFPAYSITFLRLAPDTGERASDVRARVRPESVRQGTDAVVDVTVSAERRRDWSWWGGWRRPATPTGTVTVEVDDVVVTGQLERGRVRIEVPTSDLHPRTHEVTVRYLGDDRYGPSEVTRDLTVRSRR
jgi:hypothetical protein